MTVRGAMVRWYDGILGDAIASKKVSWITLQPVLCVIALDFSVTKGRRKNRVILERGLKQIIDFVAANGFYLMLAQQKLTFRYHLILIISSGQKGGKRHQRCMQHRGYQPTCLLVVKQWSTSTTDNHRMPLTGLNASVNGMGWMGLDL